MAFTQKRKRKGLILKNEHLTKSNREETPMKTAEELNALKEDIETLNKKLAELSEEELKQVTGGLIPPYPPIV